MRKRAVLALLAALTAAFLFPGQAAAPPREETTADVEEETLTDVEEEIPDDAEEGTASEEQEWDMTPLDEAWFDDAIFFGDSISGALQAYGLTTGGMGKALFFCSNSYTIREAAQDGGTLFFRGRSYTPGKLAALTGAGKAFFMLGMNDVAFLTPEQYRACWSVIVEQLRENAPEIRIFFESLTPVAAGHDYGQVNNAVVRAYNENLLDFCRENGCVYVDIASSLMDEKGELRAEYCSDFYVHMKVSAGEVWSQALKDPANYSSDPRGETA